MALMFIMVIETGKKMKSSTKAIIIPSLKGAIYIISEKRPSVNLAWPDYGNSSLDSMIFISESTHTHTHTHNTLYLEIVILQETCKCISIFFNIDAHKAYRYLPSNTPK